MASVLLPIPLADSPASSGASPPQVTLILLSTLQPVADQLLGCFSDLTISEANRIERLLATCGSAVLQQGAHEVVAATALKLREAGFTTSLNRRA